MEYNFIGKTGLKVSRVCIGTMTFGSKIKEQSEVDKIVASALEKGINFFDTADQYNDGHSEEMLGKALGKNRREVIIASKTGYPCMGKTEFSLSRGKILDSIDGSLKRLNTDYIDVFYLHAPDKNTPLEESLEALNDAVRTGKIRYIGMSNYAAWQFCEAMSICERNGFTKPVVTETCYNLLTRGAEQEMIPFLLEKKRGMTVFNPLAGGLLTGKYKAEKPEQGTRFHDNVVYQQRYWREDNFKAITQLTEIAALEGISLLDLAFRWCLSQPVVSSVITGFSSITQMECNTRALEGGKLDQAVLEKCDTVWKTLYGGRVPYNR